MKIQHAFSRFARAVSAQLGRSGAFIITLVLIGTWLFSGRYFDYSESWRVFIDTALAIITFLMVLLLQHAQTHDTRAIQMKLDELIHSQKHATNDLIEIEKLTEAEVEAIREEQHTVREQAAD